MTCIIGLDLSLTSTGVVVLDGGSVHTDVACTLNSDKGGVERLYDLGTQLHDALTVVYSKPRKTLPLAVVEGYAMGSRAGKAFSIGEWGGAVRLFLHQRSIPFIVVPPSTLKKFTTGKGNAQKDEMRLHVYKRWGFENESNDVVDAYALARFGQAYLAVKDGSNNVDGKPMTKADVKIIREFMEPKKKGKKASE